MVSPGEATHCRKMTSHMCNQCRLLTRGMFIVFRDHCTERLLYQYGMSNYTRCMHL